MSYADGGTPLPGARGDLYPLPGDTTRFWDASSVNALRAAIADIIANPGLLGVLATGSTTARSLKDRFSDVVNVKDYGAKGDGTTDDTAAIQAAVTAAPGGSTVFFPHPLVSYKVVSGLSISAKSLTLVGSHWGYGIDGDSPSVVIDATGVPANANVFTVSGQGSTGPGSIVFQGLRILGNQTTGTGDVISASNFRYLVLRNSSIHGAPRHGLNFTGGGFKAVVEHAYIDYCGGNAFNNDGTGLATTIPLLFADFEYVNLENSTQGLYWVNAWTPGQGYIRANMLFAQINRKAGIYVSGQGDIRFIKSAVESNNTSNDAATHGAYFLGCQFVNLLDLHAALGNTGAAVCLENSSYVNLLGGLYDSADANAAHATRIALAIRGGVSISINGVYLLSQNDGLALQQGAGSTSPSLVTITGNNLQAASNVVRLDTSIANLVGVGNTLTGGPGTVGVLNPGNIGPDSAWARNAYGTLGSGKVGDRPGAGASESFTGQVEDGSSANAVILDSASVLSAAGANLLSVRNGGATQMKVNRRGGVQPGQPGGGEQSGAIYQGAGVPSNAAGNDGDTYLRTDTPGTVNQRLYVKAAGTWVGIL